VNLYHNTKHLGSISDVSQDGIWMYGQIDLTSESSAYREFFDFMTDEEQCFEQDPPFSKELLNPEEWFIEDNGTKRGIEVPAVHPDGAIAWRWR
jgi:hypothetical protein